MTHLRILVVLSLAAMGALVVAPGCSSGPPTCAFTNVDGGANATCAASWSCSDGATHGLTCMMGTDGNWSCVCNNGSGPQAEGTTVNTFGCNDEQARPFANAVCGETF